MTKIAEKILSDKALKQRVMSEIEEFYRVGIQEWELKLKQQEIQEWLPSQKIKNVEWVRRLIWQPQGISDYRRIQPELIYVKSVYELQTKDIWGDSQTQELGGTEELDQHWSILRKLVSSARDTGGGGMRMMKYLVRDKTTRKYLGVLCISSDFMNATNRDKRIGWKREEFSKKTGRLYGKLNNLAQGQAIVPTQPFGNAYNGTKLLALLCLSKEVADKWEQIYGDKLVGVTTTALWGNKKNKSSYDGLDPYWQRIQDSSGKTPINFTNKTYGLMKAWLRDRYPKEFYKINPKDGHQVRDVKKKTVLQVLAKLGIPTKQRMSDAKRLCYMSLLYKNSDLFLRGEIQGDQLEPAFDNSVAALTKFWKFGVKGDTTRKLTNAEKKAMREKYAPLPQDITLNLVASARARIDNLSEEAGKSGKKLAIETDSAKSDWYQDLGALSWDEARKKYLSQVGR